MMMLNPESEISAKALYNLLDALDTYMFVADIKTDRILFVNEKMKNRFHFGVSAVGKLCYEVMNSCKEERCEFCVKHKLLDKMDDTLELETEIYLSESYYIKKDRIIDWVDGKKAHLQYFIDITELKQVETAEKNLKRMSDLINCAPQYIAYVDNKGNFEFFNPASCEITGYSYNELMESGINLLYNDQTKKRIADEVIPSITDKGKYNFELTLIRKNGEERVMSFSSFAVSSDINKHGCIATDITEQKRLEKEIVETKEKFEHLINTAPVVYGLSIDGIVLECNDYAVNHLGMKPDDLTKIFYAEPKEREKLFTEANDKSSVSGIVRLYIKNGEIHRFFVNYHSLKYDKGDACILWAVDVEESELHNDQLRQTQQSLQTVLDFLPAPITIIDVKEGYIVYANKNAMELFGFESPKQVYGRLVNDFMPLMQPDGINSFDKTLVLDSDIPISIELVCKKANGEIFEALVTACIIDYKGKKASISIIQDLTKEKEYQRMLQNTAEKEKEANRAKSNFLSKVSHEIRTPLNAITGMAGIAKNAAKDKNFDKVINHIDQIISSSDHLLSILNDVLDMSKIESGKLELIHEPFSLMDAYRDISSIIIQRCHEKDINFITNINEMTDMTLIGDKLRVNQVLINLMGNAVKFTDYSGEIKFLVNILKEDYEKILLSFSVSDNGIGMTGEQIKKLFTPFEQTDSIISVKYGGTGLGLSISQNLINMMGGKIKVESKLGAGSKFYFEIYFDKSVDAAEKLLDATDFVDCSDKRILLVEDIDINRYIITENLRSTGVQIEEAENGQQAVDMFIDSPTGYYDLIFMDVQMPVLDGYGATRKIRASNCEDAGRIPIIAMTANVYKEDIDDAINSGMNGHLSKPISLKALMDTLEEFILK